MKKGKKNIAKRRAKKNEKKRIARIPRRALYRQKQALKKVRRRQLKDVVDTLADGISLPEISDEDYTFWLCHGVNYLLSDETTGLWDPMFESIYDGILPDPSIIPNKVMARFPKAFGENGDLVGLPMAVLAWTVTEKSTIRIYKHEAENRIMRVQGGDVDAEMLARQPHQPQVWDLVNQVKARSMQVDTKGSEPEPEA